MRQNCIKAEIDNGMTMNVLTSAEIRPFLKFHDPFRTNSFAIIVIKMGEFVFQNNFERNVMKKYDLCLITPGSLCELHEISDDVEFLIVGFKPEYLKSQGVFFNGVELMHLFSPDLLHKFCLSVDEFDDMVAAITSLKRKMNLPETMAHYKDVVRNSFLGVLYEMMIFYSKHRTLSDVKLTRQEELTSNFLSLLVDSFRTEKKLDYYAKKLFVTSRYLSQVVKKVVGKTAGEMIDEVVIREAKVLLSSRLKNVAQVSEELHFSDQSFFGKFFKKNTGISPSAYKSASSVSVNPPF